MAYKQSPFPYTKGSNRHASALKGKFASVGVATPNEDEVESAMKSHKPGHAEMDVNQWQHETEGQDQNKIFDNEGNHIGNWVKKDGKDVKAMFVKKSTESAHGQLDDAEAEYQNDLDLSTNFPDGTEKTERDKFNDAENEFEEVDGLPYKACPCGKRNCNCK